LGLPPWVEVEFWRNPPGQLTLQTNDTTKQTTNKWRRDQTNKRRIERGDLLGWSSQSIVDRAALALTATIRMPIQWSRLSNPIAIDWKQLEPKLGPSAWPKKPPGSGWSRSPARPAARQGGSHRRHPRPQINVAARARVTPELIALAKAKVEARLNNLRISFKPETPIWRAFPLNENHAQKERTYGDQAIRQSFDRRTNVGASGRVSVVCRLLMLSAFVMFRCFPVVMGGMGMMLRRFLVVFRSFLGHWFFLLLFVYWLDNWDKPSHNGCFVSCASLKATQFFWSSSASFAIVTAKGRTAPW
jgi:hypothetical protein